MKQALILLQETAGTTPSGNHLTDTIAIHLSEQLMGFMFDQTLAEVFPVEGDYQLYLLSYSEDDRISLENRIGGAFQYLTVDAGTPGTVIQRTLALLPDTDRFVFMKSNGYGWTENGVRDLFQRLYQHDVVYASGSSGSFFLIGFVRESGPFLMESTGFDTETVDDVCDRNNLTAFHLPQQPLVDSLAGMTGLREMLPDETAMARQIDDIVLAQTRYEGSDQG